MPDQACWNDPAAREALLVAGRAAFAQVEAALDADDGVVAVEPRSGAYFWGETLGKANQVAYEAFPDQWLYFRRLDDPAAEILLPTW